MARALRRSSISAPESMTVLAGSAQETTRLLNPEGMFSILARCVFGKSRVQFKLNQDRADVLRKYQPLGAPGEADV